MGFDRKQVSELLACCHRRCSICHRFCGVKIETDHIIPSSEGGSDEIENAIPVCFECHAEIHSYNPNHPRGRKFTSEELRMHKDQWIDICKQKPESLVAARIITKVGPIQALVDELEFNTVVAQQQDDSQPGCLFMDEHFRRAISLGAVSIMKDDLKQTLLRAYAAIGKANQCFETAHRVPEGTSLWNPTFAYKAAKTTLSLIREAKEQLLEHLTA